MPPERQILRLLAYSQVFVLFFLLLMPNLMQWLITPGGKILFAALATIAIGLAIGLHHALKALDPPK